MTALRGPLAEKVFRVLAGLGGTGEAVLGSLLARGFDPDHRTPGVDVTYGCALARLVRAEVPEADDMPLWGPDGFGVGLITFGVPGERRHGLPWAVTEFTKAEPVELAEWRQRLGR